MDPVAQHVRRFGPFVRRRDLLAAGYADAQIRQALAMHSIFRVRQGWYACPETSTVAVRAVRVGGRVTGISALRLMGLFLPRPSKTQLVVPANAARLRSPLTKSQRLSVVDGVEASWCDDRRSDLDPRSWIVGEDEALLHVLRREGRDLAVAAADGCLRYLGWSSSRLQAAFGAAPARTHGWARLVDGRADAWGETFLRLWLGDAGIRMEPQPSIPGVGRLDGRVSEHVYVEVDGAQHDADWAGNGGSSFESDHRRDVVMAARGDRVLRLTNTQLVEEWPRCLQAIRRARDDDVGGRCRRSPSSRSGPPAREPLILSHLPDGDPIPPTLTENPDAEPKTKEIPATRQSNRPRNPGIRQILLRFRFSSRRWAARVQPALRAPKVRR